jgi:FtsZ-binding cell division protein ZapB
LAAKEKSKKAMEEFVMALKEVNTELHTAKQQMACAQHEAETGRPEVDQLHMSAKHKDERLRALFYKVERLHAEAKESFAVWWGKESNRSLLLGCRRRWIQGRRWSMAKGISRRGPRWAAVTGCCAGV